jgi:hypothetical protein
MQDSFDFETEGAASAAPANLDLLNSKLDEAVSLKEMVDQMEEDLAAAKKQLYVLNTIALPDLMAELGVDEMTRNGWKVKVTDFMSGTLPKEEDKRAKAIKWLEDHDAASLIKTDISVTFGRDSHEEALSIAQRLIDEGYAPTVNSGVHPQALAAFGRERLKNGEELDTELLGLFAGKVAKYTKAKG